jgi:hypothetical protein
MNPTASSDQSLENQGEVRSGWVTAPGDSHVDGFELIDRSASSYGAISEIIVRFKGGKKNHSPPATYKYRFSKHNLAQAIFQELQGSDHPGAVIDAELKKKNVPFIRVS